MVVLVRLLHLKPRIQLEEQSEDQAQGTASVRFFTPSAHDAPSPYIDLSLEWHGDYVLHEPSQKTVTI